MVDEGEVTPDGDRPVLSVVILSWNTLELTRACLQALRAETPRHSREIVVIDNGSHDGSAEALRVEPGIHFCANPENRGYAGGNNQGARLATGRFVCLLNSDTEVRSGALDQMVDYLLANPSYGAVAPKLVNLDGSVQTACKRFPGLLVGLCYDTVFGRFWPGSWVDRRYYMRDFDHEHSRDVDQPPGACFMMDREEYVGGGGLDEELFLFYNDVDLCKRLWSKGRRIRYLASSEVMHHEGASTKGYGKFVVVWFRNRIAFYRKHFGWFGGWFMRSMVRWRSLEEWWKARRYQDPAERRTARDEIRTFVAEILAK